MPRKRAPKASEETTERIIPVNLDQNLRREFLFNERNQRNLSKDSKSKILDEMISHGLNDNNEIVTVTSLCRHFGIGIRTLYQWLDEIPGYKAQFNDLRDYIIDRRYVGALHKKYDGSVAKGPHGHYSHVEFKPEWIEDTKFVAEHKTADGQIGNATFNVTVAAVKDTGIPHQDPEEVAGRIHKKTSYKTHGHKTEKK